VQCFIYHSLSSCQLPFGHYIVCFFRCTASGYLVDTFKPVLRSCETICPLCVFFKVSKFTCTDILREFNIRWCSSRITGKRRMPLVEHIFHIPLYPGHLSSPLPCSLYSSSCSIFGFLSNVLYITVCPFVSFPLAMILSVFFYVRLLVTSLISSNLSCTVTKLVYAR
jgi:hypothetical protein